MSIIRQRRKNLIVSGLLGFLIGALILTLAAYLNRQTLAEFLEIAPVQTVEVAETLPALVAAKPIQKGTVLEADHVTSIMVQKENKVADHFSDVSELIGMEVAMDIDANMPFTSPMLVEEGLVSSDMRLYEVSFVELPYHLNVGDIVDLRIAFPTGQEYVVLSKKEVVGYERQTDSVHSGLLSLALEEEEALRMSSALVDRFVAEGTRVYMVKYVDADYQAAAEVTYPVNENVLMLLSDNPNILERPDLTDSLEAREALKAALEAIIDDNNEIAYKVDMTTPGMTFTLEDQLAESLETAGTELESEPPPAGDQIQETIPDPPSAPMSVPKVDSSDSGSSSTGSDGIGF